MSKKHRTVVPDFSSKKPSPKLPGVAAVKQAPVAPPAAPKVKPQATSSKSGRRGG